MTKAIDRKMSTDKYFYKENFIGSCFEPSSRDETIRERVDRKKPKQQILKIWYEPMSLKSHWYDFISLSLNFGDSWSIQKFVAAKSEVKRDNYYP